MFAERGNIRFPIGPPFVNDNNFAEAAAFGGQPNPRDVNHRVGLVLYSLRVIQKGSEKSLPFWMARREGFEPSVRFPVHTISNRAP